MIILDTTTRSLEVLLGGSVSTNQLPVVASFVDIASGTFIPAAYRTATNNASAVTAVASPASGTQRQVKQLTVQNADTAGTSVTARFNDNGTTGNLVAVTLAVNETLQYNDGEGWSILAVTSTGGGGSVTSGSVQGFFGPNRNIASGTVGVSDFGSGAVVAGSVGSGAVASGNLASGNVARFHLASGAVNSGQLASGSVLGQAGGGAFTVASGTLTTNDLGSGAIVSGLVASGQLGRFHIASGQLAGFELGSGAIVSGRIASGQIGSFHVGSGQFTGFELGSGAIVSGRIASGQVGNFAVSSGAVTSGRLGVTGTPNGAQFLRDDFTWQVGTGSSTLNYFTPLDNQPPSSVYAVLGNRNNHATLEFDNSTNWSAIFGGVLSRDYAGGNITVSIAWAALSGTTGNVAWLGSWERLNANNTNLDSDNFSATQTSSADACNGTNGKLTVSTITFTSAQISGLVAGDAFRFKLTRDTTAASNLAARAQVISVEIKG